MVHCHSFIILFILSVATISEAATTVRTSRIEKKLLDETQFSNPKSFDYNFEDDFKMLADKNDIYDELLPELPTFTVYKNGKNVGPARVPIITRRIPGWSTPVPRQQYVEPYRNLPKSSNIFQRPVSRRPTTTTGKPNNQRLNNLTRRLCGPCLCSNRTVKGSSCLCSNRTVKGSQSVRQFSSQTTNRPIQSHVPTKPVIIHTGNGPYPGPTYNCKVLTPAKDGRPSPITDKRCILRQPGVSADGRCRCTYVVSGRDNNGCATGFFFTCLRK